MDARQRSAIARALRAEGWSVQECPGGHDLVQSLADVILGEEPGQRPDLIAVDAVSPGCCGTSIARGVRQLGWSIPVALIVQPERREGSVIDDPGDLVFAVDARDAVPAIVAIARRCRPTDPRGGASAHLATRDEPSCAPLYTAPPVAARAAA
jgi:CheY-like chemotaxis protein